MRSRVFFLVLVLLAASCSSSSSVADDAGSNESEEPSNTSPAEQQTAQRTFGAAPVVVEGPPSQALREDLDALVASIPDLLGPAEVRAVASHGDARVAWLLSDMLRFIRGGDVAGELIDGFEALTGATLDPNNVWGSATDHLLAWDTPAFEGYVDYKSTIFLLVEPAWQPFFDASTGGNDSAIDWRAVSWGGVLIDERPLGDTQGCPRGCIPALDDPEGVTASHGDWYDDDAIVFGVVVNGEAKAYPKNIMEVHEMVNDTIGGRRVGIPYCTLCGSAQAYLTDSVPDGIQVPVLRTSGLLSRSNKVMFDLNTYSVFDTFTGQALSGPLLDEGIVLEQVTVITSTWGAWREAHPATTIVAQDGGIGRTYADDPLAGRDDNGPIFPIGDFDGRHSEHTPVIGVVNAKGTAVGFVVAAALEAVGDDRAITAEGIELVPDGDGFRALGPDGEELAAHQAFWFAWTQFHPEGVIWEG